MPLQESQPDTLARDIRMLKDIEEIKRLKYRYFRCIDTANLDELAGLLTDDVTAHYQGGSYTISLQGRAQLLEMVGEAFHADAVAQHNGHHPEIDFVSDSEAKGTWYLQDVFMDFRRMVTTRGTSLYRDDYVKVDGQWKIRHTGYERLYEIVEPIDSKPNLVAHYLAQHGRKEKN